MADDDARGAVRRVVLPGLPVELYIASHEHIADVLRELALIAAAPDRPPIDALAGEIRVVQSSPLRARALEAAEAAAARGAGTFDFDFTVPAERAGTTDRWDRLLDRFEELSRQGVLLTLPPTPDVTALRQWMDREIARQLRDGSPPMRWPEVATTGGQPSPTSG